MFLTPTRAVCNPITAASKATGLQKCETIPLPITNNAGAEIP